MNLTLSMILLFISYTLITLIGIIHTIINWKVFKIENPKDTIVKPSQVPAYLATKPYHPLYNIILFPIFAYIYLYKINPINIYQEALIIAITWTLISIIIDLVGWVLIKHPWSMTFKEMYFDYQPWISLIYISIFISPFIVCFIKFVV